MKPSDSDGSIPSGDEQYAPSSLKVLNFAPDQDVIRVDFDDLRAVIIERDESSQVFVRVIDDDTEERLILGQAGSTTKL